MMIPSDQIKKIPWDSKTFGIDSYEIHEISNDTLKDIEGTLGHYTVKVDPLSSKEILREHGFYYCDTLIEAFCRKEDFKGYENEKATISRSFAFDELAEISRGAFVRGRFHKDFNIENRLADLRYERWLKELYDKRCVFALMFENELAGFFAYTDNRIALHAIKEKFKGKGLAKYLWSEAIKELFSMGSKELISFISASNMPAVNLYASLGFRFRNPKDVYHRLVTKN